MSFWWIMAWRSAWSRRFALLLVMLSVTLSVLLWLGVQQLREDARRSFSHALSGVDLIVGPRGSATELMLYSVFQIGRPTRNMGFDGYKTISEMPQVRWAVPIQLGDSFHGFPVIGTTPLLFEVFQSQGKRLAWAQGRAFVKPTDDPHAMEEVVLGAEVARQNKLQLGDELILTHGSGGGPEDTDHDDHPLRVVGILQATGAPIDRAVLVNLEGFESMHQGWGMGIAPKALQAAKAHLPAVTDPHALEPVSLSAVWVGLHQRAEVFTVKRKIEGLGKDPLMAVLPGVALDELWQVVKVVENSLMLIGAMVAISALMSVASVLLVSMGSRRKELALLRAMGVRPMALLGFVMLESMWVCIVGLVLGYVACQTLLWLAQDMLRTQWGIMVQPGWPHQESVLSLLALLAVSALASLLPAWRAYRLSLMDGLHPPSV